MACRTKCSLTTLCFFFFISSGKSLVRLYTICFLFLFSNCISQLLKTANYRLAISPTQTETLETIETMRFPLSTDTIQYQLILVSLQHEKHLHVCRKRRELSAFHRILFHVAATSKSENIDECVESRSQPVRGIAQRARGEAIS